MIKVFSFWVLVFLFICGFLFECFHVVPFFKDNQKAAVEEADWSIRFAQSFIEEYEKYDKPVVWRLMTSKERAEYQRKNDYSYSASRVCLINNFGRAIVDPLHNSTYSFNCDEQKLKKWIAEENKIEKETFLQTGHCRDYWYWQEKLKEDEQEAIRKKDNATMDANGLIFLSFLALFVVFGGLWQLHGFIFRCLDKKRKRGVRKEQGKKYLDLSDDVQ